MKAGLLQEAFIFRGRAEEVEADGTAGGEFVVRDGAADDERVAEEKARARFEDSEEFTQQREAVGDVAENVVGEGTVEGGIVKRERLRGIADLELRLRGEVLHCGKSIGVVDSRCVEIDAEDAAPHGGGKLQGIASGTATDFEYVGVGGKLQGARDFGGFFGGSPTGLAEILAVGFEANVAIDVGVIVGVGVVVEVDSAGHRRTILQKIAKEKGN